MTMQQLIASAATEIVDAFPRGLEHETAVKALTKIATEAARRALQRTVYSKEPTMQDDRYIAEVVCAVMGGGEA